MTESTLDALRPLLEMADDETGRARRAGRPSNANADQIAEHLTNALKAITQAFIVMKPPAPEPAPVVEPIVADTTERAVAPPVVTRQTRTRRGGGGV
jgi:hypothetical protein